MRKAHQILAGLLAGLVVIQAMAIAYAIAGVFHWIDKDGGVLNAAVFNSWDEDPPTFQGSGGHFLHAFVLGQGLIPLLALALLIVSFFVKDVSGAARRGAILFGMVALQIVLGISAHDTVLLAPLHALNGFGIFVMAAETARKAREAAPTPA